MFGPKPRFVNFLFFVMLLFILSSLLIMFSCTGYQKEKIKKEEIQIQSPVSEPKYPQEKVTAAPNKIHLKATITASEKFDWPMVKLTLDIEEVIEIEGVDFLKSQKHLETYPQFATDYDGSILQTNPENQSLFKACDLLVGEKITAALTYQGDEHDGMWYMISFRKIK